MYLQDNVKANNHIIAANEGHAVALASGYYLTTGKLPLVYLQNSGLGNVINPLTSLNDKEVYGVPLILMIGWRGRPGVKDEPQHIKMGRITEDLLRLLEIPYFILGENETIISNAIDIALRQQQPVALLITENFFEEYNISGKASGEISTLPSAGVYSSMVSRLSSRAQREIRNAYSLSREHVLQQIVNHCNGNETVICTTGKTGREFYEINKHIPKNFLSVGAMGLANHIALGINMNQKDKVIMIDGDGALLMHLGTLPTIAKWSSDTFIHIVINNGAHESVGGQPTLAMEIDLCQIASACGYENVILITEEEQLTHWLQNDFKQVKKQFVELRVNTQSRNNLSRPLETPAQRKQTLMNLLLNRQ